MASTSLVTLAEVFGTRTVTRAEADVQQSIAALLTLAPLGLGDSHVAKVELPTGDGTRRRIDVALGRLIIEVKKDLTVKGAVAKAEPQLRGYLQTRRIDTGDEYAGVITDGVDWHLYTLTGDELTRVETVTLARVDSDTVARLVSWLDSVLLTGPPLKPTPGRIEERLGSRSPRYKLDHARLDALYHQHADDPEIALKRQLWARLLRTALGTAFEDDAALFVDHTLLVIEAEVIAHLAVGLNVAELTAADVLSGAAFRSAQIANVVEPDFFDWPASIPGGESVISDIIRDLQQFNWADVQHDVLKHLYEAVISPETRKGLGEYYTPDWLARRILEHSITDPLEQRAMDPSCGSGTFVFHAVRRFLAAADEAGIPNAAALEKLTATVFGMDIHPVSVVLARVTYLLAITPARLQDRGALSIPVYLGDSMQWGRGTLSLQADIVDIEVDAEDLASVAEDGALGGLDQVLSFPLGNGTDPAALDLLIATMGELVAAGTAAGKPRPAIGHLLTKHGIDDASHRDVLTKTFATMYSLAEEGRDHIWAYFVRNQLRPLWLARHRVDVLIGNPPWVAYRYMTPAMQTQFKLMSEARGLWEGGKLATQQDLVGLFVARAAELFLNDGGRFAFVVPYAVLSRMQYRGFRKADWYRTKLNPTAITFGASWDLADVRPTPFPVPSAVIFGQRTETAAPMGEAVTVVTGRAPDALVETPGTVLQLSSEDGYASQYAERPIQGATIVPRVLHFVEEIPAGPLGNPAGIIQVTSSRSNGEKKPWKDLVSITGPVEREYVHDVLMGASVVPYRIIRPHRAVLPVRDGSVVSEIALRRVPELSKRWAKATAAYEANRTAASKLSLHQNLDFQGKLRRQLPAPAHRVVYSASGNRIAAAHVGPEFIVEHGLYWLAVGSIDEARYLVAILNSDALMERISKYQARGLFGERHIDMLPWRLAIPYFDAERPVHAALSTAAARAAELAATLDVPESEPFTTTRKRVRDLVGADSAGLTIESAVLELLDTPAPAAQWKN